MKNTYNNKIAYAILAAGEGTRMRSTLPKVLFDICGKTMIEYVLETVAQTDYAGKVYIIVGHKADIVKDAILKSSIDNKLKQRLIFVYQKQQLGTADAVKQLNKKLPRCVKYLVVLSGDVPLISPSTINKLISLHIEAKVDCTVASFITNEPTGYGRIVRDISKHFVEIVEEIDATDAQKLIKEVNAGVYVFSLPQLWSAISKVKPENKKGEYYLTDTLKYIKSKQAVQCGDAKEFKGVNSREELTEVIEYVRHKIINNLMRSGVTIMLPQTVYVDWNTKVGEDTQILQGCIIMNSQIGRSCVIGPNSYINFSNIGNNVTVTYSHIVSANIGDNCSIGPFSRIRPETTIADNVSIGNFVEIKKSEIKSGTKINHLSYIGDTTILNNVNIGAGTITCNYDGIRKHKTYIGKRVFIGSNVNLIAPINVGDNVVIAAGSTISKDVPANTFVIARTKEIHKPNHRIVKRLLMKHNGENDE